MHSFCSIEKSIIFNLTYKALHDRGPVASLMSFSSALPFAKSRTVSPTSSLLQEHREPALSVEVCLCSSLYPECFCPPTQPPGLFILLGFRYNLSEVPSQTSPCKIAPTYKSFFIPSSLDHLFSPYYKVLKNFLCFEFCYLLLRTHLANKR